MSDAERLPKTLTEIIDAIEKIREGLLTLQRSLEKIESAELAMPELQRLSK
jgi:hypothetical protein